MSPIMEQITIRTIERKVLKGKKLSDSEEQYLIKKIDQYWETHPDVELRFPRWKKYMAWVAGYQYYDYNKYTRKLVEIPLRRKRRLIFNRLRSFVRALLAKLNADVPTMGVIPKTSQYEDIEAARIGDKVVQHLREKFNFTDMLTDIKLWTIVINRAFIRVFWNEDDYGVVDYTTEMEEDEEGEEIGEVARELRDEGDVGMESVSPLQCRADPLYFEQSKWRWFVYGEEVDCEKLEEKYGIERGTIKDEKDDAFKSAYDLEYYDESLTVGQKAEDVTGRTTVLKHFWTPKIWVDMAGTKILDYDINEWEEIPFYVIEERLIPISSYEKGFQFNESLVKDAIPIQREYNRQLSLISTAIEKAGQLKVLVPSGSLISKKQFTNDYGVFIDYNSKLGAEPHQLKLDPLPAFVQVYKTELEREFETAFGVREASFGRLPERASHASGTLVNLLLEQDDVLLNPLLATINKALGKAWTLALRIVQNNYSVSRFIRFTGEDGDEAVMKFLGADLKGNTDVKVTSQAGLPRSRALRVEYIMQLFQAGIITDVKNVLEMLEFGQAEKIFEDDLLHEKIAYRENELMQKNPEINPEKVVQWLHPLELSEIHLKIHSRLRFSPRYNKLNENQRAAVEKHLEVTAQTIQQQRQAEIKETMEIALAQAAMKAEMQEATKVKEEVSGEAKPAKSD